MVMVSDLPNPIWPYTGTLTLTTHCAQGSAENYAYKHFPDATIEVNQG